MLSVEQQPIEGYSQGPELQYPPLGTFSSSFIRTATERRVFSVSHTITSSFVKSTSQPRIFSRVGSIAETFTRLVTYHRINSRSGSQTSTFSKTALHPRIFSRAGSMISVESRSLSASRVFSRVGTFASTFTRHISLSRTLSRSGSMITSFSRLAGYVRSFTQVFTHSDTIAPSFLVARFFIRVGRMSMFTFARVGVATTLIFLENEFNSIGSKLGLVQSPPVEQTYIQELQESSGTNLGVVHKPNDPGY